MYARAMCKGRIIVVSRCLNREELNEMMLGWAQDLQDALDMAFCIKEPNIISVLPNAVNIIPKIKKGDGECEK
jgi:predicted RNA-binding protein